MHVIPFCRTCPTQAATRTSRSATPTASLYGETWAARDLSSTNYDGGDTYNPCVINCCNRGDITVNGSSSGDVYIGGIMGYCYDDDTEIGCSYSRANLVSSFYDDLYCGGILGEGDFCDTNSQWELLQTVSGALAPEYSRHDGGKKAATFSGSEIATALNVAQAEVPQLSSYIQNIPDMLKWKLDSDGCPALSF